MSIKLSGNQQVALSVVFFDEKGFPAARSGVPVWAVSEPGIATLDGQSEDGLSVTLKAVGVLGETAVTATVDGITVSMDVAVVGGAVVGGTISAGEVIDQPVAQAVAQPVDVPVDVPVEGGPAAAEAQPAQ